MFLPKWFIALELIQLAGYTISVVLLLILWATRKRS